jgi:hypothetical protein
LCRIPDNKLVALNELDAESPMPGAAQRVSASVSIITGEPKPDLMKMKSKPKSLPVAREVIILG